MMNKFFEWALIISVCGVIAAIIDSIIAGEYAVFMFIAPAFIALGVITLVAWGLNC